MFSICLSVSQSVILCSVSLSQSVSQLVNYLIRQKDRKKLTDQQINQIRQTKRHTDKKMVFCPSVSHLVLKKRQASLTEHHCYLNKKPRGFNVGCVSRYQQSLWFYG